MMANKACPPCPALEVPEDQRDTMWAFLMMGGQKSNIPALKEAVGELCHAMMQKTAGQKKYGKGDDVDFAGLNWTCWRIVMEAVALVLSGDLDKLDDEKGDEE